MDIHAKSELSDSVVVMMLTMVPYNDYPSQMAGGAGADEARQDNALACWIMGEVEPRRKVYGLKCTLIIS